MVDLFLAKQEIPLEIRNIKQNIISVKFFRVADKILYQCTFKFYFNIFVIHLFLTHVIIFVYSVDGRDRDFKLAERWSDENVFANRAYFMPEKQPAELGVDHIRESDQAVYRCRVDFKEAQTRNSKVNLTVIGK